MKRLLWILLAAMLLPCMALAQEVSAPVRHAMANLTEIFGYTQEEAEAFAFDVSQTDSTWEVTYYDPAHPTWVYTASADQETGQYISATTPFKSASYSYYPGENAVRDGLRTARENGWFTDLSPENRSAFLAWMEQWGVHANEALRTGLTDGAITGAQAVQAYFVSCYGDPADWPQALTEWRDAELAAYGWETEAAVSPTSAAPSPDPQGINRYSATTSRGKRPITVTEFSGDVPEDLQQALSHPMLAGWTCVCGAYTVTDAGSNSASAGTGLLTLEKDGARMLVSLRCEGTGDWQVLPIGSDALLTGRELYITYDVDESKYVLSYPLSATEYESFLVFPYGNDNSYLIQLYEYRHINTATGEKVIISPEYNQERYNITTINAAGVKTEEQRLLLMPNYLEYIQADTFPKTAEAFDTATGYTIPDAYAVSCGVHLRKSTSSRSADLGEYNPGVLAEVLGTEPGDPYTWYHVRIGSVEGYMSSIYVAHRDSVCSMRPLSMFLPLPVAKTTREVKLKKGTGWFAGTVTTLPAGTKMHVLAETGGWLHVMVPQNGDPGWLMDSHGTDGYLKADSVITAGTSLQLDWQ